jgi:fatty-acyl-CoA synthase
MRAIDYFDKGADAYPERVAIIDRDTPHSYRETRAASERIARAMWASGLRGEERVAIYSPNDARVLLAMLGMWRAGGVWVPVNPRNALEANAQYMNYAGTAWLLYHSSFHDHVGELKARVPTLRHFVCIDAEDGDHPSLHTFMQLGSKTDDIDWADPGGNPQRLVGLIPTGGTTGPAKGVMCTNLAWGTMVETGGHYFRRDDVEPVCLSVAPLTHAAGVVAMMLFPLGATNVVMPGFDALEVLRNIERFRVTHLFLPPTA